MDTLLAVTLLHVLSASSSLTLDAADAIVDAEEEEDEEVTRGRSLLLMLLEPSRARLLRE